MFLLLAASAAAGPLTPEHPWGPDATELQIVRQVLQHRQAQRDGAPFLTASERRKLEGIEAPANAAGFADLHSHAMSDYAFGRRIVAPGDAPCDGQWHGLRGDLMKLLMNVPSLLEADIVSDLLPHCPTFDVPSFDGWTHEQFLTDDLHYAWTQGMRLMVMYAVNNALLCAMSSDYTKGVRHSCADEPNIEDQVLATWELEEDEAERDGGWLRVSLDPLDGARALAQGQMAVVLGVEASNYFDYPERGGVMDPSSPLVDRHAQSDACDYEERDRAVRRFEDNEGYSSIPWSRTECGLAVSALRRATRLGIRSVVPVHEWNSVMGGAAFQNIPLFQPGYSIVSTMGVPESIGTLGIAAQLVYFNTHATKVSAWPMPGEFARDRALGIEYVRNFQGVTPMGRAFLRAAWDAGVVIDIGHYGERALEEVFTWIERSDPTAENRPMLIDSHVTTRSVSLVPLDDLEFAASETELRRMSTYRRLVIGMRTPLTASRPFHPARATGRGAVDDCLMYDDDTCVKVRGHKVLAPGDARALAQVYGYLRELPIALAFGADMNGGATQTAPRLCVDSSEETKRRIEKEGMNVDLSQYLVPCGNLKRTDEPSPYLGRGLSGIAAQPHLLADLDCLVYAATVKGGGGGAEQATAACLAARTRGGMAGYCASGTDNPLCQSARWFVNAWADPAFDVRRDGRLGHGDVRGRVEMLGTSGVASRAEEEDSRAQTLPAAPGGAQAVTPTYDPRDRPFPRIRFAGSGGSWVQIDREAERRFVRQVRTEGNFGPDCRTLDQRLRETKEEK